jgi:hypothetical protein
VPCSDIAHGLGRVMVKNIVALGALHGATRFFPDATYLTAIRKALGGKAALVELNEQAFAKGARAAEAALAEPAAEACPVCGDSQADGVPCEDAHGACDSCGRARPAGD